MNKQKILITGSCGFIMGNLVRKSIYEKQPYQLVSLDRVNSHVVNSMYWNKNHIFHIADITDQHTIDIIFQFEKPDIVIHGASESQNDAMSMVSTNVLGTQNIINACLKHKIDKLLFTSTNAINKNNVANPCNTYNTTKLAGELLVLSAQYNYNLNCAVARLSNSYGPRQSSFNLIPKTIKNILNNIPIILDANSMNPKDWIHVFDTCSGILNIVNQDFHGEIYNISSNQELSDLEVVQKICNIMGKGHDLITFNKHLSPHHIDNNSEVLKNIGWEPKYKFKNGLLETVEWYLNNQWWFK